MERGMNYRQGKNSQQKEPTARKESLSPTNPLSSGGYIYICPLSSAEREMLRRTRLKGKLRYSRRKTQKG